MKREVQRYFELLERRLSALRSLAITLQESRAAFTELNLEAIHRHNAQQQNLCTEIRFLDQELVEMKEKVVDEVGLAAGPSDFRPDPEVRQRSRFLLGRLLAIQADVRRLNRVHAELVRRSRRSVNVLINLVATCRGAYPPSPPSPTTRGESNPLGVT